HFRSELKRRWYLFLAVIVYERAEHIQVLQIGARVVVGCFEDESGMREFWMLGHATECLRADVAFANMPMSIDTRIVRGARIIEMNNAHPLCPHRAFYLFNQSL